MPLSRAVPHLALSLATLLIAACATPRPAVPRAGARVSVSQTVRVRHAGRIHTVPLDTYAAIVALTEIAPGAESNATAASLYTAQIVIARTYAASRAGRHGAEGFDLCDATHCQRYEAARLETARWAKLARQIARDTAGEVLVYGGATVEAVFHADCGGHTADAADVWRTARPYLIARRDDLPEPRRGDRGGPTHREWDVTLTRADVEAALRKDRRTRVAGALTRIEIVRRDVSGRAARLRLTPGRGTPVEVDGDVFRAVVNASLGIRALPSTRFTLSGTREGWRVKGTGFGHGVGLCQMGALARARSGASPAEILRFYYPGAIIERARAK